MRVEIIKIEDDAIKTVTTDDKVVSIPKNEIDFKCDIGDSILIEDNGEKKNYYLADIKTRSKKSAHKKKVIVIVIICLLLIAGGIAAAIFVPKIISEIHYRELSKQLDSCLYDGFKRLNPSNTQSIDELDSIKESIFRKADGPRVERIGNATLSIGSVQNTELLIQQYKMAITCYNKYQVGDYQERVSELESYEVEANYYLESAKNQSTNNGGNPTIINGGGRNSVNCTTNTIGDTIFTNCY